MNSTIKSYLFLGILVIIGASCSHPSTHTTNDTASKEQSMVANSSKAVDSMPNSHTDTASEIPASNIILPENFGVFTLRDVEQETGLKVAFSSFSDIYPLSEDPDSMAIPSEEEWEVDNKLYFELKGKFRERFLNQTHILESDTLYVFDYSSSILKAFPIKQLRVVAYLNIYRSVEECPCDQYDYMIGFELPKNQLRHLKPYYLRALVYAGKENPFVKGQMQAIVWKKISPQKLPKQNSKLLALAKEYGRKIGKKGQAYTFETPTTQVFLQDYTDKNGVGVVCRHIMLIEKQTASLKNEQILFESEGTSLAQLNFGITDTSYKDYDGQWIGTLFKNRPEVIFGFDWISFGCPSILFVDDRYQNVPIYCDNRH